MTDDHLTPHQRQAVETLDRSCVVTAGPGAGKTRVLVERVLNILRQGKADLEHIVAITFTNKAANEMKEKIRRTLLDLAESATDLHEAQRWYELKQRLEDAAISTIHGFCASILKAQPVEAEIDPEAAILDEYTSQLLLYQAVEEVVNRLVDEGHETVARLVMGYSRRRLIDELVNLYTAVRAVGLTLDDIERLTLEQVSTEDDYRATLDAVERTVSKLLQAPASPSARKQIEAFGEVWTRYRPLLPMTPRLEDAPLFDRCFQALRGAKVHRRGRVSDEAAALQEHLENLELVFYDVAGRETLVGLIDMLREIEARYRGAKAERNGLDYEDLQLSVRDLFRTHPWLARQYAEKYRFILVDEFQDTNRLQKEIISLLTDRPSPARAAPSTTARHAPNLFIVGDEKQSIYNFRGAAVEVFMETARELEERGAAAIALDTNFRSTASLIDFHNAFFSRFTPLASEWDRPVLQSLGYVEFTPSRPNRPASPHPPVELILEIGEQVKNAEEGREVEAARLAARIAEMVERGEPLVAERAEDGRETRRPVRYGDIAMLFRAMTDIKVYERALRRRGIPYYVVAGRGFYQREEIQDVISLLRFLENRTDEIALVAALRSPLFGLSDETLYWLRQSAEMRSGGVLEHHPLLTSLLHHDEVWGISEDQRPLVARAAEILSVLLERRNRVPLAELLEDILTLTDDEAIQATFYDGHQRVANLRKLVELARGFEERGPFFLRDFIHFIAEFTEMETRESEAQIESGAADAVQIMTVHKAKGLEFPLVIIPDLARRFRSRIPDVAFDRGVGIGMKIPDHRGRLHETRLRRRVAEYIDWREFFENQRLFYVAATRAQDYLILSGAAPKLNANASASKSVSASALREADSWLDWVCAILQIDDPQSLPEIYHWNGIPLRVMPGGAPGVAEREATRPLIDRFPEMPAGRPVPTEALPELTSEQQGTLEAIIRLAEPLALDISAGTYPLAVTRLLSLARCPLQYYYETVLGLPGRDEYEPMSSLVEPVTASGELSAAARGTIVHRFCELYDGSEKWESLLERLVGEEMNVADVEDVPMARQRAVDEVKPLIEHYLASALWREIELILWGERPGRVESEVEFIYRADSVLLRGRIDKLIVDGEGRARLIDFKTNRVRPEQVAALAEEYDLQMRIYALVARRVLGLKEVRGELYFLHPDVRWELDVARLNDAATGREIEELCQQVVRLRKYEDAVARPDPERCRRCRCFSFCPSRAIPDGEVGRQ